MQNLDIIKLRRTAQGWVALWQGPHATLVRELFDTDTLPLGFTAQVKAAGVLEFVSQLNPDALVVLEQ
ncbi:hypothetical protein LCGC14_2501110 [marine sediment metagenome]|uniref:Uncharacterized protein n=1 Tax=marine sediment metagenome TaxID=412755 RepID=A0A0F9B2M1_9ZZZZ